MKNLLAVTGLLESGTGLALIFVPGVVIDLLLHTTLDGAAGLTAARIAGAALFALAMACWLARDDSSSGAAHGLGKSLVVYNLAAVFVLGAAGAQAQTVGILLWPAVFVHAALAVWCVLAVNRKPL